MTADTEAALEAVVGVGVEEVGDYSTFESKLGNKPRGSQVDTVGVAEPEEVQEVEAVP